MRNQLRWYGASPLHLLAMLASFGLAGYAAARLASFEPLTVIIWFVGAAIGHDLLLVPLYSLADRSVMAAIRHREPPPPAAGWINYVRVPAALSGLLLLVWFPLIFRLPSPYHASTTLSPDPYVWHWLAVSGVLFLLSAVAFALRLRRLSRTPGPPEAPAAASDSPHAHRAGEDASNAHPRHQGGPEHKQEAAEREEPEPAARPEQIPAVPAGQEPAVPDEQPPAGEVPDLPSVASPDAGRAIQTQDDYE